MTGARHWPATLLAAFIFMFGAVAAQAEFPDRPVHFTIGFAAGGGVDVLARLIGQKLSEKWGQPVIVENRPGADGTIAADLVAHAPPDGYSMAWVNAAHAITPGEMKLNFDPVRSFAPVMVVAFVPHVVTINAQLPVNSLKDLIAYAKAKPGQLNFGSTGKADLTYLETELLMQQTGIDMVHVPFKGGSEAMVALLANEIQYYVAAMPTVAEQVKTGKLKALAVSGKTRSPVMPDVPTLTEAAGLQGIDVSAWLGLLATAGTPKEIVAKINRDISDIMKVPETAQRLAGLSFVPVASTPDEFTQLIQNDMARWAALRNADTGKK